jgi:hypothetical protein
MRAAGTALGGAVLGICALAAEPALARNVGSVDIAQEVGVSLSDYRYSESGMSLTAVKLGIDYSLKFAFRNRWFVKGSLRHAVGDADYRGTGTMGGVFDWYFENRWVVGREFPQGRHTWSPHAGLGYRYLYNDLRGTTSTGAVGYRRESQYLTLPIGLTHAFALPNRARLVTTLEYDHLIRGRQDTRLSDIEGRGHWIDVPDVVSHQRSGYGWRLSHAYQADRWSVGGYVGIWRIGSSDRADIRVTTTHGTEHWTVWEPANQTREVGARAIYRF